MTKPTKNQTLISPDGSVKLVPMAAKIGEASGDVSGSFAAELNLKNAAPPESSFSAQVVTVEHNAELGTTQLFFIGLNASRTRPSAYVCVRLAGQDTQQFLKGTQGFFEQVSGFVTKAKLSFDRLPEVSLEDLDRVDENHPGRTLTVEGSAMYMAHQGAIALCDVYQLPVDTFVRNPLVERVSNLKPIIRVDLPTVSLFRMLTHLRGQMKDSQ